jgi:hypothetical protein
MFATLREAPTIATAASLVSRKQSSSNLERIRDLPDPHVSERSLDKSQHQQVRSACRLDCLVYLTVRVRYENIVALLRRTLV